MGRVNIIKHLVYIFYGALFLMQPMGVYGQFLNPLDVSKLNRPTLPGSENLDISALLRKTEDYRDIRVNMEKLKSTFIKEKGKDILPNVGDSQSFFVRNVLNLDEWFELPAFCIYASQKAAIWLSADDQTFFSDSLDWYQLTDSLAYYLEFGSGPKPLSDVSGIINTNKKYFGEFPNVAGDGLLHILLLDIEDNFEETGSFVAGFFDPVNLIEHEFSNMKDLIYIDIYPAIYFNGKMNIQMAASTIAHEMQHLIHSAYELEEIQYTFVNEGLSEYAEVLNGFPLRNPDYYFIHPERALFSWDYEDPLSDYARGSLFFTYLFEQIGADKARYLVTERKTSGYSSVEELVNKYSGLSFSQLFSRWGQSLLGVKEQGIGYKNYYLKDILPAATQINQEYPSVLNYNSAPLTHYFVWNLLTRKLEILNKADSEVSAVDAYPAGIPGHLQRNTDIFYADAMPYGYLRIVLSNNTRQVAESDTSAVSQNLIFSGDKSGHSKTLAYDDGIADAFWGNASYLQLTDESTRMAVIFGSPGSFWLSQIAVKAVFSSELAGSEIPVTTPREIILQVFTVKNGRPEAPITPEVTHTFTRPLGNLRFESIPLNSFYEELSSLKDSVAVVIKNSLDTDNYIVAP